MKTKTIFWSLSFLGLTTACQMELGDLFGNNSINDEFPNVDEALWPYFQRFEEEAATRSIEVDLNDAYITGLISDISTTHVLGQCSYSSSNNHHKITIDKPFWNQAADLSKEFVVFHELGHCYLGRLHDESKDPRGVCLSMMRSGTGDCRDNYNTTTRVALINELFDDKD